MSKTNDLKVARRIIEFKSRLQNAEKSKAEAIGALAELKRRLKKDFKCPTVRAARQARRSEIENTQRYSREIGPMIDEFDKTHAELLRELE